MEETKTVRERITSVEQRMARLEERVVNQGELFSEVIRRLDKLSEQMNRLDSDTRIYESMMDRQVAGLTDITNRITVWSEKSTMVEKRIERLEEEHRREIEERKEKERRGIEEQSKRDKEQKDRTNNIRAWLAFAILIFTTFTSTLVWFANHVVFKP